MHLRSQDTGVPRANIIFSFYTLAADPEMAAMLKEEVQEVLERSGGEYTSAALQDMKKVDSFLKELLRFHPLQACKSPQLPLGLGNEKANISQPHFNARWFSHLRFRTARSSQPASS